MARLCIACVLAGVPVGTAPAAVAVTPPAVDDSMLPKPGPPTPPRPTEQRERCATAATTQEAGPAARQFKGIDLRQLWRLSRGAGQTVAVIDTGVARHRLLPHLVPGGDYVHTSDGTVDCDGHGTVVAGIIGAEPDPDGSNFSGVAPDATIVSIRQSSNKFRATDDPTGSGFGDVDTLARAIRTAADLGATVINVSSVACLPADGGLDDRPLGAALAYAVDVKNAVVVAAAGNVGGPGQCPTQNPASDPAKPGQADWDHVSVVVSPAWYDDYVLTVGSVDPDGAPSSFSLAGPWVDVAAPGEGVVSLDPDGEGLLSSMTTSGDPTPISGTSYAAPVVSGIVALVRSRSPELTAREVMRRIETTARRPASGWDPVVGNGVVDAVAALSTGATSPRTQNLERPLSQPTTRPEDGRGFGFAVGGAAVCLAVSAASIAVTASTARLRRSRDTVPRD
ncbi:type VII secretion-associated serine protease mycosin [Mycobacterium sp. ACS1612]|nr:type VII secretion-associated serine protease mycosin [Mycobacterium sp. ACS1612]OBF42314.1 type VII secretion-associated serine protease mycosin [Mycobacterium sp. ACS1612]